jgi:hypothetical protein
VVDEWVLAHELTVREFKLFARIKVRISQSTIQTNEIHLIYSLMNSWEKEHTEKQCSI